MIRHPAGRFSYYYFHGCEEGEEDDDDDNKIHFLSYLVSVCQTTSILVISAALRGSGSLGPGLNTCNKVPIIPSPPTMMLFLERARGPIFLMPDLFLQVGGDLSTRRTSNIFSALVLLTSRETLPGRKILG